MREQEEAVQKEIDDTYQQLIKSQESHARVTSGKRVKLSQEAATDLQEKLQLHSLAKGQC